MLLNVIDGYCIGIAENSISKYHHVLGPGLVLVLGLRFRPWFSGLPTLVTISFFCTLPLYSYYCNFKRQTDDKGKRDGSSFNSIFYKRRNRTLTLYDVVRHVLLSF